ncbi:MAG TPA: fatty acyl-AMP ligase [Candidatus Nanopelagicales bacterium]|nr:fatty acyl-AMP ligase [Candidatus Nanopelagicales bacterium]
MRTLIEVLRDNAVHADRSVTFVRSNHQELTVSYPELWLEARRRAHALRRMGLERGDRVALILPDPDEFVLTFLGALTAGIVAVPMYPPQTMAKLEAYGDTVRHVLAASGARALVTNETLRGMIEAHLLAGGGAARIVTEAELRDAPEFDPAAEWSVGLEDLAFLQFTSGSTSHPKGVMVTFRNLAVNSHAIMFDGLKSTPEDRGVSWLPLYHDMGLIGFVIAPLYALVQVMFLPTTAFIRRPSLWLEAIHRFRGTITFAPNFAFALATRAVTDAQAVGWDLSCMRALGCGAEPIQADVLRGFLRRFAIHGLRPESILPSYGMAEATLAMTFSDIEAELVTDRVDLDAMRRGVAQAAPAGAGTALELVSCGRAFPGHELAIVGPDGAPLGERQVGEVWLRGPSVTAGYFGDAEATREAFGGGWLRTGDLGYLAGGELYICGRAKDLIILGGKNYYPQDIERAVSQVEGIRDSQCVAFSRLDAGGGEKAVVVAECRRASQALVQAVVRAVRAEIGVQLAEVVLIKRGTLAKTSSGKVRRREMKRRLEAGELELAAAEDTSAAEAQPKMGPQSEAAPSG